MGTRLAQIMFSMTAIAIALFFVGCAGEWSQTGWGSPLVTRQKIEFPFMAELLNHNQTIPTIEEEKGIFLRYTPQSDKFKYNCQFIIFTGVNGDEGYKQHPQKCSEIVKFISATDGINLIRDSQTEHGLVGGFHRRMLIGPRGGYLKLLESAPTGIGAPTTILLAGDQFSSLEIRPGDLFPEERVKVGQTWIQKTQEPNLTYETLWRLVYFAEVRGHRCAVLSGIRMGGETSDEMLQFINDTWWLRPLNATVLFFDYKHGLDIECITAGRTTKVIEKPATGHVINLTDVTFCRTSLVE